MKGNIFEITILCLVIGSFILAVIDPGNRPLFADMAKVVIAAYVGHSLPK